MGISNLKFIFSEENTCRDLIGIEDNVGQTPMLENFKNFIENSKER